jgi:hypothetical protein
MLQPTTRREYRSSTAARYSHPSRVGRNVMSATDDSFGFVAANCRSSTFSATGRLCLESVVCLNFLAVFARRPACRMIAATVLTQQPWPAAFNSAWMRGLP